MTKPRPSLCRDVHHGYIHLRRVAGRRRAWRRGWAYLDGCRVLLGLAQLECVPYPSDRKCAMQHKNRTESRQREARGCEHLHAQQRCDQLEKAAVPARTQGSVTAWQQAQKRSLWTAPHSLFKGARERLGMPVRQDRRVRPTYVSGCPHISWGEGMGAGFRGVRGLRCATHS